MKHRPDPGPDEGGSALTLIDLDRYPLHAPDGEAYARLIRLGRAQLAATGCVVFPGFIRRDRQAKVARQVAALAPLAYRSDADVTVYGGEPDPSFPEDHPRRRTLQRHNAFVAGDQIPETAEVRVLYHDRAFHAFLAACLGMPEIFEFADPLASLVINVVKPGAAHPWHFDTNEFIVTLLTQPADDGGVFEYCPNLRAPGAENYDRVAGVVDGGREGVHALPLRAGDLQIFFGRHSLHRVTRVGGSRDRHTVILAYAKQPNMVGQSQKTRRIFGRVGEAHEAGVGQRFVRDDSLQD